MSFTLPKLPYSFDALEPFIDAKTMEIHYTKHHQTYVDKLNAAVNGKSDLENKSIEELMLIVESLDPAIMTAVWNNGGGHYNHSLFWEIMAPQAGGQPVGELLEAIKSEWGDVAKFQDEFNQAALNRFGSGWAWLVLESGKLHVGSTPNQDNPVMKGNTPIIGIDVWEHAYYLKYQNKRADYVTAWWSVVNWEKAGERYSNAKQKA